MMAWLTRSRRPRWPVRLLLVVAFNALIGVLLPRGDAYGLWGNLLAAQCIGLSIWALIDGGLYGLFQRLGGAIRPLPTAAWVIAAVPLGYAIGSILADGLLGHPLGHTWRAAPTTTLRMLLISLVAGGVATYVFVARELLARARLAEVEAQRQASEARLKLLEAQLDPHMLFNTLANLRALIGVDPAAAQRMVDRMNRYLRATLSGSRTDWHPLAQEFERVQDYLELMQVRMGDRLRFRLVLPPALQAVPVPPLLLQPLVENAIRHGLEPVVRGGWIEVRAAVDGPDGMLVIEVCDSGGRFDPAGGDAPPAASTGTHFGLEQVRARLAACYGAQAGLELLAEPGPTTVARVRLPVRPPTSEEGVRPSPAR